MIGRGQRAEGRGQRAEDGRGGDLERQDETTKKTV
jgi:hypothetical protein